MSIISTNSHALPSWAVASQWSVITSAGRIYVFFLDAGLAGTRWAYSDDGGQTWSGDALVGAGVLLAHVAIDGSDNIYMATTDGAGNLYLNVWNGAAWGGLEPVATNLAYLSGKSLDVDAAGNLRIIWTTTGGEIEVRHRDLAGVWSAAQTLTTSGTCRNPNIIHAAAGWYLVYDDTTSGTIWGTDDTGAGWAAVADTTWIGARPNIIELASGELAICYDDDTTAPMDIMFRETTGLVWGDEVNVGWSSLVFGAALCRNDDDDLAIIIGEAQSITEYSMKYFSRPSISTTWGSDTIATGLGSSGFFSYAGHSINTRTSENPFCIYPDDSTNSLMFKSLTIYNIDTGYTSTLLQGGSDVPDDAVAFRSVSKSGAWAWQYKWTGDGTYEIYHRGDKLATTAQTTYSISAYAANYEPPEIEVVEV